MSALTHKIVPAMVVVLAAGLGTTAVAGPAQASWEDGVCPGMNAPQNNRVANLAPVVKNETVGVVAGDLVALRPLANDTDPNGDKLYVVNASAPAKGETCLGATGILEFFAYPSSTNYTQKISYGVTDGDLYRTGTLTVAVEGVKPVRGVLKQRLLIRKGGKVKRRAIVSFTNPNRRNVYFFAGNPRKDRPDISRTLGAGKTLVMGTRLRRLQYVVGRPTSDGDISLVSFGLLNTRNGRQRTIVPEDFSRTTPAIPSSANRWLQ
ncbi:MAG: Ig-like domain-containing protein [Marmoricola sp.]